MSIIGSIIAGIIVGILARVVLPGRQAVGWLLTILLGVAGAVIGWLIAGWLGVQSTSGVDWLRWIISVIVAAVLIVGYERLVARRAPTA